jgi:hypothetical protein
VPIRDNLGDQLAYPVFNDRRPSLIDHGYLLRTDVHSDNHVPPVSEARSRNRPNVPEPKYGDPQSRGLRQGVEPARTLCDRHPIAGIVAIGVRHTTLGRCCSGIVGRDAGGPCGSASYPPEGHHPAPTARPPAPHRGWHGLCSRSRVDRAGLEAAVSLPSRKVSAFPSTPLHILMLLENATYPGDPRVRSEAHALVGAGYRVSIIAPRGREQLSRETVDGVEVYRFLRTPPGEGLAGYAFEFGWAVLAMLWTSVGVARRSRFDIIHMHNPPDLLAFIALPYRLLGCRCIFDHHDLSPELYNARNTTRL